jgi:large-conductance mechanosensitive channel
MIPIVLFLLFLLPGNLKEILVLHRDYSSVYDIFTTNFIHEEFSHLAFNVMAYTIVIFLLYILLLTLNKKELFYKLLIINLSIVPILISLIWIPVNKFRWTGALRTLGFSGIVSSICGMVVYAYILLLHEKIKINTFYAYLSSIFLIPLLFTLTYFTFTRDVVMIIIALAIVFFITTYKTTRTIDKKAEANLLKTSKRPKTVKLLLPILYLILILFSVALFPKEFIQGNIGVNFFIHYTGFIIGTAIFFVVYFICTKK